MCHSSYEVLSLTFPWKFTCIWSLKYVGLWIFALRLALDHQSYLILEGSQVFKELCSWFHVLSWRFLWRSKSEEAAQSYKACLWVPLGGPWPTIYFRPLRWLTPPPRPQTLPNAETQGKFQEWCAGLDSFQKSPPPPPEPSDPSHQALKSPFPSMKCSVECGRGSLGFAIFPASGLSFSIKYSRLPEVSCSLVFEKWCHFFSLGNVFECFWHFSQVAFSFY